MLLNVSLEMVIYKDGVSKYTNNQPYPNEIKMLYLKFQFVDT